MCSQLVCPETAIMDASSLEALVYDPTKCSKLSVEQKRELIYEVAKRSDGAAEMLQAWSRHEILQVLCAEMGKERKYTGLTKSKMIEHLLKIVYDKKSQDHGTVKISDVQPLSENGERTSKRQRKSENHPPVAANATPVISSDVNAADTVLCKNSACKAKMNREDVFCKRCSCCICRQYDDNKDPSLWLICNSDLPFHVMSCGMSCHLECALRHENSGISKDRQDKGLDGSFCCVSCGEVNDLLGSWRKQLVVARDTRKVDELCYRLSLGQKILAGTKHYLNLYRIVDEAVQNLEEEMGPLTGIPVKKARGIVNRLSSGQEVQKLCASAVESLDLVLSNRVLDTPFACNTLAPKVVRFEDIRDSSVTGILNSDDSSLENVMGYSLWHRKVCDNDYSAEPTCKLFSTNTKFLLSDLSPATQYFLKVVTFDMERDLGYCEFEFCTANPQDQVRNLNVQSPVTNFSSLSNPSSVEDEINNAIGNNDGVDKRDKTSSANYIPADKTSSANLLGESINGSEQSQKETAGDITRSLDKDQGMETESNAPLVTGMECVPYVQRPETGLPITPCKLENLKESSVRNNRPNKVTDIVCKPRNEPPRAGSSSKKRSGESRDEECNGTGDKGLEYYVKVIRRLECDGYIETTYRQKFLTWYSLRASPREVQVVKAFIDTLVDDPESLAGQLVDTFSDVISNKRSSTVPAGFCTKLWHY